ncbi:uncharacterized protein LOC129749789 [Uranotaenia lowii]|uniref:uncharacterized protein LOC129749789 n=1 Tax=Uranotaenia lowii TaxID=190385 RepID=UPI002479F507|nr:uncharacterized protein LOC129749789 [Uranotaenia lowii]XP_055600846.1 uncharacterized protein LOC129749789 [Uranotaenia lowii]XP_055600847.1 uncharacterized protein LOC129749789 [Uranotaenia lowii]
MSFDSLPIEMMLAIFEWLNLNELYEISVVNHHWYRVAGILIARRCWFVVSSVQQKNLETLMVSERHHRSILIQQLNSAGWEQIEPVLSICSGRLAVRQMMVCRTMADSLKQLFQKFGSWLADLEELHVSFDHRFLRNDGWSGWSHTICLPKVQQLYWSENHLRRGNRTISIDAPVLKRLVVNDSFGSKLNLILMRSDKMETLECTLYRKNFGDMFQQALNNLTCLILRIYNTIQDVGFLRSLGNLTWLNLALEYDKELLPLLFNQTIEIICKYKTLEGLQIHMMENEGALCSVSLAQLGQSLPNLVQLELNNICLKVSSRPTNIFQNLALLKLTEVVLRNEQPLYLNYPNLEIISLSLLLLPSIVLQDGRTPQKLFVNLDAFRIEESIVLYLLPFLNRSPKVRDVTLYKTDQHDNLPSNFGLPQPMPLAVDRLHLINLELTVYCIQKLAESETLRHLILTRCVVRIRYEIWESVMPLHRLKTLQLRSVQLDDSGRMEFPFTCRSKVPIIGRKGSTTGYVFNTAIPDDFTDTLAFGVEDIRIRPTGWKKHYTVSPV